MDFSAAFSDSECQNNGQQWLDPSANVDETRLGARWIKSEVLWQKDPWSEPLLPCWLCARHFVMPLMDVGIGFTVPTSHWAKPNLCLCAKLLFMSSKAKEEPELDVIEFYGLVREKLQELLTLSWSSCTWQEMIENPTCTEELKINPDFLNRNVNEGRCFGNASDVVKLC